MKRQSIKVVAKALGRVSWPKHAPMKTSKRREVAQKFGKKRCFLRPSDLGYPICDVHGRVSCKGLMAAYKRARQQKSNKIASRAKRKAKRLGCPWSK